MLTDIQRIKMLEKPKGRVDAVIDTDTYNETDDQFAVSYMLANGEKINTKAIFAAPFTNGLAKDAAEGMEKSYDEILKLLTMGGYEDMKQNVKKGSCRYLPDEKTPVESEAARYLCSLATGYSSENPLYVVAIGAITNIASALLMDETLADRIVVIWLGGNALHWHDTSEFNMYQDIAAARVVFGCGVPLVIYPCAGVVSAFTVSGAEFEKWFFGKNRLADYLARNATAAAEQYAKGKPWTRVIWDVTAVSWLCGDFETSSLINSPIPEYDRRYSFDRRRHLVRYVYGIKRDRLFEDLVNKLT